MEFKGSQLWMVALRNFRLVNYFECANSNLESINSLVVVWKFKIYGWIYKFIYKFKFHVIKLIFKFLNVGENFATWDVFTDAEKIFCRNQVHCDLED